MSTEILPQGGLDVLLRALHLPSFVHHHQEVAEVARREGQDYLHYLSHLCQLEMEDRGRRKIERLIRASGLPPDKTMASLDLAVLPDKVRRQIPVLCQGHFLKKAENILAFGLPGRGKTHLLCAIGHELVRQGHPVLFVQAFKLVQRLLTAKQSLTLEKELKRLDRFQAVIIDDIGYVQQDQKEMEVLFTFLAERYERASVMISSNLVFSQWDKIFQDAMTTAAAIDRLVHHCTILELTGSSYRTRREDKKISEDQRVAQAGEQPASPEPQKPRAAIN